MKLQHGLVILSFLWCLNANAQQSTGSTGNFAGDLGGVAAAIRAWASVKEICADSFPAFSKQNEAAYLEWRKKYLPFLQEMERIRLAAFMKQVNGNQAELIERSVWWEEVMEINKQAFRQRFLAAGPEAFRQTCQSYPVVLQSDRGNLEHFYAEQVATLRKMEDAAAARAQYNRGVTYIEGQGVVQDYAEAVKWFSLAAAQGLAVAQFSLGVAYAKGQGVVQNYAEAIKWYKLAAAQGDAPAQFNLGSIYERGQGVAPDYAEAVKWYRLAAAQGLAQAQSNLGFMYSYGQGVVQNYAEAVKWYRLAAAQGLALAQSNLGAMYNHGQGVTQDYAEAVKWYRLAAVQGDALAQLNLGAMYANGQGVPQDYVRAHMWFNLGAGSGNADAMKYRDGVAKRMTPQQMAEALKLARECQARNFKSCD